MKQILIALLLAFAGGRTLYAQQIYASKVTTGSWGATTTWEVYPGGTTITYMDSNAGATATDVPSGSKHVYIRSGHVISMDDNRAVNSITIATGGALVNGAVTTSRRLQVADGGGGGVYPINATITNNGRIGGSGDDGRLYIEPGAKCGQVTFAGTGVYNISRLRISGGKAFGQVTMVIDADMTFNINTSSDAYGLSAVYAPATTDNYVITINAGKRVTINGDKAFFHYNPASTTWGTYTYNINGILDLSATTGVTSISPSGGTVTLNVNGTVITGKSFTTAVNSGTVKLRVNNGGLIDASLASVAFSTANTTPYLLAGTGAIQRKAIMGNAIVFPVSSSDTTYNPVTITNNGSARIFTVSKVKPALDYLPAFSYLNKQWNVTSDLPVDGPATIGLGWTTTDTGAATLGSTPAIARYADTGWAGVSSYALSGAGTKANPYMLTAVYPGSGDFIVGNPPNTSAAVAVTAEPSFHSCSVYYPSVIGNSDSCQISYRKTGKTVWLPAFSPVYDSLNQQYRGSIVRLDEKTSYDLSLQPYKNGTALTAVTITNAFTTWDPNPAIDGTAINISTYINTNGAAVIQDVSGSTAGWKKITATAPVNATYTATNNAAVTLRNCHYVILEGITITGGYRHGIDLDSTSDNIRIINCNISGFGRIPVYQESTGIFYDANNLNINYDAGINMLNCRNVVVERCYIHDHKSMTNAWSGIMQAPSKTGQVAGWVGSARYESTHPQGASAVFVNQARGGVVLRYNDFIGSQAHRYNDMVESNVNSSLTGGFNKDADIYGNMMAYSQDDAIELDGGQCNVRLFDNRMEQSMTGISIAPNRRGPSYIFNNLLYNLGNTYNHGTSGTKAGGGDTYSQGIQHFFNNTIISPGSPLDGVGYGTDANRSAYKAVSRNNIFLLSNLPAGLDNFSDTATITDQYPMPKNNFDYDMMAHSGVTSGAGTIIAAAGNEVHGLFTFPRFTSLAHGVFTLDSATNPAIDKGTVIPNFTKSYSGSKPDLGAFEFGSSSLSPRRPVDMYADKYYINTRPDSAVTVTITVGNIGAGRQFSLLTSNDMGWLTVTSSPAAGAIAANSTLTLTCTATELANSIQKGMLLIRLDNGFSIPITVGFTGTGTQLGPDRTRLANLTTNRGSFVPAFSPLENHYSLRVPNSVASLQLTPTVTMPNTTVQINNITVTPGNHKTVNLPAGEYFYTTVHLNAASDSTMYNTKTVKDYFITIYREAADSTADSLLARMLSTIAIQDQPEEKDVVVFPNPASKEATILFPAGTYHTLQLIDAEGRIYNTFRMGSGTNRFSFPLTGLAPGIYHAKLIGNRKVVSKKILKL